MQSKGWLALSGAVLLGSAFAGCSSMSRARAGADQKTVAFQVEEDRAKGAEGKVQVWSDQNQQHVVVTVNHLDEPQQTAEGAKVYVVWLKPDRSEQAYNLGTLRLDNNRRGELKTTTPFRDFSVFVTAEVAPDVAEPSSNQVMRASVEATRSVY